MKRLYMALLLACASCTTEPNTSTAESAVKVEDCTPGGNFPDAKLPKLYDWNGATPPAPGANAGYVVWQETQGGSWNAVLADPSTGTIVWAVTVQNQKIGTFLASVSGYGRIDVGRVPPPPPPVGDDWKARYALEMQLRLNALHVFAMTASQ